ncbi:biliverdin-producing heme oxygenase [Thauera sp.]|jgi:heme oxygenase|uniref:biliverdin-producing heme oxygenase n=1 Tax=Thauera sp. TaxID=1905334 RepID=UPI002A36FFE2|nr:biliverdin-producing heme oxygenase [Thauera sp.]MDX9886350.1 biliverdin-producing heme oxygenase [Thauera sp.]
MPVPEDGCAAPAQDSSEGNVRSLKLTVTTGNLLLDLREGTNADHRRVEMHALLRPLVSTTLSLEQYSRVIAAFTGFHDAIERRLTEISSRIDFPGYRYQPRLPLLVEDRAALPPCAVTPCKTGPVLSLEDERVGVLYVLEGATQGGLVIAPCLSLRLGLGENAGARYFNLYRQRSWQQFRTMLAQCQQHYDPHLAVRAARATFDHLHAHLDLCLSSTP